MVANKRTVGKLEKSSGLNVWIETINIRRESKIFVVKNMSSRKDGRGITIITININIATGRPKGLIFSGSEVGPPNVFVRFMTAPALIFF
jgi:hypothetical protein